jgi:alkaline phosphatase
MTMKLRNRLIALVCLIFFLSIGAGLFLTTTKRKPFAIILFTADNIVPNNLAAARIFSGGGDGRLQIEGFPFSAVARNAANDYSVPDTASASTAIAAGQRVNRGALCMNPSGAPLSSLLEDASMSGRATGLLTTGSISGPSAAACYSKTQTFADTNSIRTQFINHQPFDLVAGGASEEFIASMNDNHQNRASKVRESKPSDEIGYAVVHSISELEKQPFWKRVPTLGVLTPSSLSQGEFGEGNADAPSLSDLVRIAIRNLQSNSKGYLLVVDDPMIGADAAANDAESMFRRLIAFDRAVGTARRYAGDNALIIVTGRENIGGMNLNGYPFLKDKGISVLAMNNDGYPSLCWATGPGFAMEKPAADSRSVKTNSQSVSTSAIGILSQPSGFRLPGAVGTAGDVLSLGSGPGSEKLHGFIDLTEIHRIISEAL